MKDPRTLQEAIVYFSNFDNCRAFVIDLRWSDGKVRCPYCGSKNVSYLENAHVYKCYAGHPKAKFSLKVGTIMEDSALGIDKWLVAMWLIVNCKNGISSMEIHRDLGITQKSAWHMAHRIRFALHHGSFEKLSGHVEVDETYIGGKARNMHLSKRQRRITGVLTDDKTTVMGFLERGGKVHTAIVENRHRDTVQPMVKKHVRKGAALYTDELGGYQGLLGEYRHQVINHAEKYVDGQVHTNGLENFWSLLKRGIAGSYVSVEPFHLFRYLDEQVFRYNNRATKDNPLNDFDRFKLAASQIVGKRLTWNQVTGREEGWPSIN
jgi:transposase-like protein